MIHAIKAFFILARARRSLRHVYRLYRRKASSLPLLEKNRLQEKLLSLQAAIVDKKVRLAQHLARELELSASKVLHKNLWDKTRDFVFGLILALSVAIPIRQVWFEFYTIPTGSMRPTLKESDALLVSKTDFSINTLGKTSHIYFDPSLVERGSIVIFSTDNMDVQNADTMYFYLIPGKKQFIKRLIGKPGDTLYFYGGKIYGMDEAGKDLTELRDTPWFQPLEHIPFIRFDGDIQTPPIPLNGVLTPVVFYQMNEPVARLSAHFNGTVSGDMLVPNVKNYYDLWGFKNFAVTRITRSNDGQFFLELTHHPSLQNAKTGRDLFGRVRPEFSMSVSQLPLDQDALDRILSHMTTARFIVKDGRAYRHGASLGSGSLTLKGVPNGMYEILDGKPYRIFWGGISWPLKENHPLLNHDPKQIQLLYNLGIEFESRCPITNRYAYFRDGALYLMGAPVFSKEDPALQTFVQAEQAKPLGFVDMGPPLKADGTLDQEFVQKFGVKIPPASYLALGDNHAMSGDSRQFGFVPEANLRGGASLLLSPPGPRWGRLPQAPTPHLTLPNLLVWGAFLLLSLGTAIYFRHKAKRPLKF